MVVIFSFCNIFIAFWMIWRWCR